MQGASMPGKWKVTGGGASAQQKADRLRSRADKLGRQATAWETGAEREGSIGKKLAELPPGFTVLHDLRLPGTEGRLDHFVISAGGLYLVDAKKYSGHLIYSKKMLWHGRFPIVDKLETLAWEAETLGGLLGREVVPVMCFVDAVLPQPVTTLGTVIVCRTSVLHTIVRSTHATMSAVEVGRVTEAATKLTTPRRAGSGPAVAPVVLVDSVADVAALTPEAALAAVDDETFWTGPMVGKPPAGQITGQTVVVPSTSVPAISTIPPIGVDPTGARVKEPVDRRWARRAVYLVLGGVLAVATVVVVWKLSRTSETNRLNAEKAAAGTTTTTSATKNSSPGSVAEATTTTVLDLTKAGFSATCPVPGAGWSLRPVWPGNLDNLAWYAFSFEQFDTSFTQFAVMTAPEFTQYTPTRVPSGGIRAIRIQPVFKDATLGTPSNTVWIAPEAGC
jgi:hypothetical protein